MTELGTALRIVSKDVVGSLKDELTPFSSRAMTTDIS